MRKYTVLECFDDSAYDILSLSCCCLTGRREFHKDAYFSCSCLFLSYLSHPALSLPISHPASFFSRFSSGPATVKEVQQRLRQELLLRAKNQVQQKSARSDEEPDLKAAELDADGNAVEEAADDLGDDEETAAMEMDVDENDDSARRSTHPARARQLGPRQMPEMGHKQQSSKSGAAQQPGHFSTDRAEVKVAGRSAATVGEPSVTSTTRPSAAASDIAGPRESRLPVLATEAPDRQTADAQSRQMPSGAGAAGGATSSGTAVTAQSTQAAGAHSPAAMSSAARQGASTPSRIYSGNTAAAPTPRRGLGANAGSTAVPPTVPFEPSEESVFLVADKGLRRPRASTLPLGVEAATLQNPPQEGKSPGPRSPQANVVTSDSVAQAPEGGAAQVTVPDQTAAGAELGGAPDTATVLSPLTRSATLPSIITSEVATNSSPGITPPGPALGPPGLPSTQLPFSPVLELKPPAGLQPMGEGSKVIEPVAVGGGQRQQPAATSADVGPSGHTSNAAAKLTAAALPSAPEQIVVNASTASHNVATGFKPLPAEQLTSRFGRSTTNTSISSLVSVGGKEGKASLSAGLADVLTASHSTLPSPAASVGTETGAEEALSVDRSTSASVSGISRIRRPTRQGFDLVSGADATSRDDNVASSEPIGVRHNSLDVTLLRRIARSSQSDASTAGNEGLASATAAAASEAAPPAGAQENSGRLEPIRGRGKDKEGLTSMLPTDGSVVGDTKSATSSQTKDSSRALLDETPGAAADGTVPQVSQLSRTETSSSAVSGEPNGAPASTAAGTSRLDAAVANTLAEVNAAAQQLNVRPRSKTLAVVLNSGRVSPQSAAGSNAGGTADPSAAASGPSDHKSNAEVGALPAAAGEEGERPPEKSSVAMQLGNQFMLALHPPPHFNALPSVLSLKANGDRERKDRDRNKDTPSEGSAGGGGSGTGTAAGSGTGSGTTSPPLGGPAANLAQQGATTGISMAVAAEKYLGSDLARAVRLLDATPTLETHKIGVVYVGQGQKKGTEILRNPHGSVRYTGFLDTLGTMLRLRGSTEYCGGLDTAEDRDGEYTYVWRDALTSVVFHVATLMPSREDDEHMINKMRYIGNDHVTIVFNDDDEPFRRSSLSGAVNFVYIVVDVSCGQCCR